MKVTEACSIFLHIYVNFFPQINLLTKQKKMFCFNTRTNMHICIHEMSIKYLWQQMVVSSMRRELRAQANSCRKSRSFYFFHKDLDASLTALHQRNSSHLVLLSLRKIEDVLGPGVGLTLLQTPNRAGPVKQLFPPMRQSPISYGVTVASCWPWWWCRWTHTGKELSGVQHTDSHQNKCFWCFSRDWRNFASSTGLGIPSSPLIKNFTINKAQMCHFQDFLIS